MPQPGPVRVVAYGRTDVGRVRADNQDRVLIAELGSDADACWTAGGSGGGVIGPQTFVVSPRGALMLVADGMGGRAGGARASGLLVDTVRELASEVDGVSGAPTSAIFAADLADALLDANAAIFAEGRRSDDLAGMGTTATLAGVLGDVVYVAQVGDSRAYLVRSGGLVRLTRDQSLVQDLIDSGLMEESDAGGVPNNMLLQALGPRATVRPDVTHHQLRRGDVLLLCSDGLSQVVSDQELARTVDGCANCSEVVDHLVALANERGGPDNVTVLAAMVDGDGLQRPQDGDRLARERWEDA